MKNRHVVLRALDAATALYPQLRVGQLLSNAVTISNRDNNTQFKIPGTDHPDLFNIEDDLLAEMLVHYISQATVVCPECTGRDGKHFLDCSEWGLGNKVLGNKVEERQQEGS